MELKIKLEDSNPTRVKKPTQRHGSLIELAKQKEPKLTDKREMSDLHLVTIHQFLIMRNITENLLQMKHYLQDNLNKDMKEIFEVEMKELEKMTSTYMAAIESVQRALDH